MNTTHNKKEKDVIISTSRSCLFDDSNITNIQVNIKYPFTGSHLIQDLQAEERT